MNAIVLRRVAYNPKVLIQARKLMNLSQREAAKSANIHYVTLCNIEKGCATSEDTIGQLCLLYGIEKAQVFDNAGELVRNAKKICRES